MSLKFGCGPAAGRIALFKLLDISVKQEDLCVLMRTRDGYTFPTNFAKAMRNFDLTARVIHPMSIEYFRKRLEQPGTVIACAYWNHWYIATDISESDMVTFYSGIEGKRIMSLKEFEMCWIDKTRDMRPVINLGIVCSIK